MEHECFHVTYVKLPEILPRHFFSSNSLLRKSISISSDCIWHVKEDIILGVLDVLHFDLNVHKYLKHVDSKSRHRFWKYRPQNPFLGKFGSKNLKLSLMSENWYTVF